jgi:UDP-N-acetylmuramate dehydrogenase
MTYQRKTFERLKKCAEFAGRAAQGEELAARSTFRIGGRAALFAEPENEAALIACLRILKEDGCPFVILGGGSNVLFPDGDFDRAVVSTRGLCGVSAEAGDGGAARLVCGAGVPMERALDAAFSRGLCGLEAFAGLPGTVGGAVYMNARCYGVSVSDTLVAVRYIEAGSSAPAQYVFREADWAYKRSPFQAGAALSGAVITGAAFAVIRADREELERRKARAQDCVKDREAKGHFAFPSAGSVFKNDRAFGKPTGQLIDEAGLKGTAEGGAQVAPWHGNIIINRGGATARDVKTLMARVAARVRETTGFVLEPEIVLW